MGHRQNQDLITPIRSDFGFNKIADWITLAVRLLAKIAAYLVSIGQLLCLAFLYGWLF